MIPLHGAANLWSLNFWWGVGSSPNFTLLVLLLLLFCDKNIKLANKMLAIAEREARNYSYHQQNNIPNSTNQCRSLPTVEIFTVLQYTGVALQIFFAHIKDREVNEIFLLVSQSDQLSSTSDIASPDATKQHLASITKCGSQERHFIYALNSFQGSHHYKRATMKPLE